MLQMHIRIPFISLVAAGALTLGGCAYGDFGYGGLGVGYGYGDPLLWRLGYGNPYGGYGYRLLRPCYGWYDDYYYPGTGVYVYDSYRRPHVGTTASDPTGQITGRLCQPNHELERQSGRLDSLARRNRDSA